LQPETIRATALLV